MRYLFLYIKTDKVTPLPPDAEIHRVTTVDEIDSILLDNPHEDIVLTFVGGEEAKKFATLYDGVWRPL